MPDERQDSIRQGISAPDESPTGKEAEAKRRRRAAEGPELGGGLGGTSDACGVPGGLGKGCGAERRNRRRRVTWPTWPPATTSQPGRRRSSRP
jgi:hypothetical protein